jgi:O-antigen/teichoic acid export membrane protein
MIKDALKQFFTYGTGSIAQTALNVILLPLYLRLFEPSQYGVISLLVVVTSVLAMFAGAGMTAGLFRLYYEAETRERKKLVGNTFIWYLIGATLAGAMLFIAASPLSQLLFHSGDYAHSIRLLGGFFFFSTMLTVPFSILRLEERSRLYVGFSLLRFLIDFGLKLYFIGFLGRGIDGYFESGIVSSLVILCSISFFVRRYVSFSLDLSHLKQLLQLGAPFIFTGLAVWVMTSADRLILNHFTGQAAVGVYSLAYTFAGLFTILLSNPISLLIDPFFFSHAASMTDEDKKKLLNKILIYLFLAGGILYLSIALGAGDVLKIFTFLFKAKEGYLEAAKLVPLLALAPMLYLILTSAALAALQVKKPKFISIACCITAAVSIGLNFALIPIMGIWGAATTSAVAYMLLAILCYWWADRVFPVSYSWWGLVKGLFFLGVAFAIGWIIQIPAHPWLSLFTRVAVGVMTFGLLVWFAGNILTADEKGRALNYIRNMGAVRKVFGSLRR